MSFEVDVYLVYKVLEVTLNSRSLENISKLLGSCVKLTVSQLPKK